MIKNKQSLRLKSRLNHSTFQHTVNSPPLKGIPYYQLIVNRSLRHC